jgi:hypothetical protein
MHFKTNGFPKRVTEKIEIPRIEDLLMMPFVNSIHADDLYKIGTDFQRYLIDKTPITNKKKYVQIQSSVKLLTPNISPVINDFALDKEWHVDGHDNFIEDDVVMHIVCNKTSSMTEFNCATFEGEFENSRELISSANDKYNDSSVYNKLIPKEIEEGRIYTFNNTDLHRAKRVEKPEFRFFFRVVESDIKENDGHLGNSFVFHGNRESLANLFQEYKNGKLNKLYITKY